MVFNIEVNNRVIQARKGETILTALKRNGIKVPTLCNMKEFTPTGACRMCVVEVAGLGVVQACETRVEQGMEIVTLDPDLTEAILEVLPKPGSSAKNPIDAANPFVGPDAYREIFLNAAKQPGIDIQFLIQLVYHYKSLSLALGVPKVKDVVPYRELAEEMEGAASRTGKPIVLVLPNIKQGAESLDIEEMNRDMRTVFLEKGIPVYDDIRKALRAVGHVSRYCSRRAAPGS